MKERVMHKPLVTCLLILMLLPVSARAAQILEQFENRVSTFTLDNGLTLLVIERHRAPVASFVTFVDVGGVNEPQGHSGIAHFSEHMAFKGTTSIGTTDWRAEKALLSKVDAAYRKWLQAKYRSGIDRDRLEELRKTFEDLKEQAKEFVVPNAFAKIIERNGGTDLNAGTSKDYTMYFCSLPANRAELWFSLESDRLMNPVFREFFTEKEVVLEERRQRVDSDPIGRMVEELLSMAYAAHPYGTPTIGWQSDIVATTRQDMRAFYEAHYVPENITIAVAGDVDPEQIRKLAETYFGPMADLDPQLELITKEPQQGGERSFIQKGPNQPVFMEAYHSVDQLHKDAKPLELLADILARGRISRLYNSLVDRQGLAQTVQAFNGFPGDKYPGLFLIYAVPHQDVSLSKLIDALHQELRDIRENGVTQEELDRAKTRIRADLIRSLKSNLGLARKLAKAEAQTGDWRWVFSSLDEFAQVDVQDIKRVARKYLRPANRTAGRMIYQDGPEGDQ